VDRKRVCASPQPDPLLEGPLLDREYTPFAVHVQVWTPRSRAWWTSGMACCNSNAPLSLCSAVSQYCSPMCRGFGQERQPRLSLSALSVPRSSARPPRYVDWMLASPMARFMAKSWCIWAMPASYCPCAANILPRLHVPAPSHCANSWAVDSASDVAARALHARAQQEPAAAPPALPDHLQAGAHRVGAAPAALVAWHQSPDLAIPGGAGRWPAAACFAWLPCTPFCCNVLQQRRMG
jgi:hypothetical protein